MPTHAIPTRTHGRYLTSAPDGVSPTLTLVGFHGQSETAAIEMAHLERIRGDQPWLLVSVQGLHRYYTRRGDVVAAWMTREDRELAIADNIAYVDAVMTAVRQSWPSATGRVVYAGFSQGTAMAYRAAAFVDVPCAGLLILAGDVPPDVAAVARRLPAVLLGRGRREEWYTAERAARDVGCLQAAGVPVTEAVFEGAHERTAEFEQRARDFVNRLASAR